jgi:hypothetical protein
VRPEEWLFARDADQSGNRRFWLIPLPNGTPIEELVRHVIGRWRVEQDYC